MATITVTFTSTTETVTGSVTLTNDGDVARILAANGIYLGTADDHATADQIALNLTNELIGNTTTIEQNQQQGAPPIELEHPEEAHDAA